MAELLNGGLGRGPWAATRYASRALGQRRLAALGLVVAIALTGGVAVASAIGAGRAQHAVARFIRWSNPEDASAYADPSASPAKQLAALDQVRALPGVVASQRLAVDLAAVRAPSGREAPLILYTGIDPPLTGIRRARVVEGRLADPHRVDEVAVNEDLAHRLHVSVGDRLLARVYPRAAIDQLGNGQVPKTALATVPLRIAGIVRQATDLEADPEAEPGTLFEFNGALIYATPAFFQRWGERIAGYGVGVRVRLGRGGVGAFADAVDRSGAHVQVTPGTDIVRDVSSLDRSAAVESAALWAVAALVIVVGLVLVGPALARTVALRPTDRSVLGALGLTRFDLLLVELRRALPVVGVGALGAVPVGLALAPHAALGVSKRAQIGGGQPVPVLLVAGAVIGLVAVSMALLAATSFGRSRSAPAQPATLGSVRTGGRVLLSRLADAGAPAALVAGARMALPSTDRNGGVIRSAVVTVAGGVALLVAALTFSSSMAHLVDTPSLRGWTWDVEVGNYSELATARAGAKALAADRDVADFTGINQVSTEGTGGSVQVAGLADVAMAQLPALSGRLPSEDGEIALTPATAAQLHAEVGDRVTLRSRRSATFRVVGMTLGPGAFETDLQLRQGGITTLRSLARLTDGGDDPETYLVRFRDGVDPVAARARLQPTFRSAILGPYETTEVQTVRRIERLPLFFAGLVALLALGALVHAMSSALRHNRREVALLKALGFGRGQVRVTLLTQAALLVALACAVGVPIGLIVGRWAWRWAARGVGVLAVPVSPAGAISAVLASALATALVIGSGAARAALQVPAADALRRE